MGVFCPLTGWAQSGDKAQQSQGSVSVVKAPEDMFADIEASAHQVYPGEVLKVDYLVYVASGRGQVFYDVTEPEFSNWYIYEGRTEPAMTVNVDGKSYTREPFATYYISTYKTGKLLLPNINVKIPYPSEHAWITHENRFIQVVPLPQPVMNGFSAGNVGKFEMSVDVSKKQVNHGDVIQLNVRIISNAAAPKVQLKPYEMNSLEGFEVFPVIREKMSESVVRGQYQSEVSFRIRLKALKSGKWTLPSVEIVTFDPQIHRYRLIQSDEIPIEVLAGESGMNDGPDNFGEDKTNVKTDTNTSINWKALWWLWVIPLIGIMGALILIFMKYCRNYRNHKKKNRKIFEYAERLKQSKSSEEQMKYLCLILDEKYHLDGHKPLKSLEKDLIQSAGQDKGMKIFSLMQQIQQSLYSTKEPVPCDELISFLVMK